MSFKFKSLLIVMLCSAAAVAAYTASRADLAVPESINQRAIKLLSEHLAGQVVAARPKITVVATNPQQWSDSSLGCREPGQFYMQVVTSGYKVELEAEGKTYFAHLSNNHGKICHSQVLAKTRVKDLELTKIPQSSLLKATQRDLARMLNTPPQGIKLLSSRPTYWQSAALGCPQPQQKYKHEKISGFIIEYSVNQQRFTYHTDERDKFVYCTKDEAGRRLSR